MASPVIVPGTRIMTLDETAVSSLFAFYLVLVAGSTLTSRSGGLTDRTTTARAAWV